MKLFPVAAVGLAILASAPRHATAGDVENGILAELNFARTHPSDYARTLRRDAEADHARLGWSRSAGEDSDALDEAIDFLTRQEPLRPLHHNPRLTAMAQTYVAEQGPSGEIGHVGPGGEGFSERLRSLGAQPSMAGEDISYGYSSPGEVVRQLIIDSGVPGRGHRQNIFTGAFQAAGASCGRHTVYRSMCVIDFAGGFVGR